MGILMHVWDALRMAFAMFWEIFWALSLGFSISGAVQAVVSKKEMTRLLPDASPSTLLKALGLGAASSSCSYAAVAITRSLIRKGADFTAAMAFQFASTNLVVELGIISYLAMVLAGLIVEALCYALHLVPAEHRAKVVEASIQWNYTTVLNLLFGAVALLLVIRFFRTGGPEMLALMDESPPEHDDAPHGRTQPQGRRRARG